MFLRSCLNSGFDFNQALVRFRQIDFLLGHCRADVAGDIEIEVVFLDLGHLDPAGVARLLGPVLIGADDFLDVLFGEGFLAFAFLEMLGGVDEKNIIRFFAAFEHEDADGNTGGVEEVRRQADDRVDVTVFDQVVMFFSCP